MKHDRYFSDAQVFQEDQKNLLLKMDKALKSSILLPRQLASAGRNQEFRNYFIPGQCPICMRQMIQFTKSSRNKADWEQWIKQRVCKDENS